jgi:hypothetical protein
MDQLITLFKSQQGLGVLGLVGIAAYLLYSNWSTAKTYWPFSMFAGGKVTDDTDTTEVPTRREAIDHMDLAFNYFESIDCKEGMDLIGQAVTHAFHDHEHPNSTGDAGQQLINAISQLVKPATPDAPLATETTHEKA